MNRDYQNYSVEDFVLDKSFRDWVKNPDHESNLFWKYWLAKNPEKEAVINQARKIVLTLDIKVKYVSEDKFLQVWEKISFATKDDLAITPVGTKKSVFKSWQKIAAVFIGFVLLAGALSYFLLIDNKVEYTTGFGEKRDILLPDKSQVTLNANSKITFYKNWQNTSREVWMEGEAFFNIKKLQTNGRLKNFIVHSDEVEIEVLGTSFNINNRKGKNQVVLSSGKIKLKVEAAKKQLVMHPGQLVEFTKKDNKIKEAIVDPSIYSSWKDNKLIFKNTPFSEIVDVIEQNYGYQIMFDEKLNGKRFTGTLPSQDIDVILHTISEIYKVDIKKKGDNQLIIKLKKTEPVP